MPKITFVCEHPSLLDSNRNLAKITYESNREYLYDIIEDFEDFLRGAGFVVDGKLEIVEESTTVEPTITIKQGNTVDTVTLDNGDVLTFPNMNQYDTTMKIDTTYLSPNDFSIDINRST